VKFLSLIECTPQMRRHAFHELLAEVDRDIYRKAARLRSLEVLRYRAIERSMIAPTASQLRAVSFLHS